MADQFGPVSIRDNWKYTKPKQQKQFSINTTPTKKKQPLPQEERKWKTNQRKWKPSVQNVHISLPWCVFRVCKLSQPVPLGHKQQCRAQMIEAKEKEGSVGERLLLSKLCEFVACKSNSHRVKTLYYMPPVAGTVGGIRVCSSTVPTVFSVFCVRITAVKITAVRITARSTTFKITHLRRLVHPKQVGWLNQHERARNNETGAHNTHISCSRP